MIAQTHPVVSVREAVLFVAFALSRREWKLALTSGFGVAPWLRTIAAGDLAAVARVIAEARRRFGLSAGARVVSCYESVLLAIAGATFGCLFAYIGIGALVSRLPQSPLPGEVEITLNAPVLLFSLAAAGLSAVLFGLTPALFTARRNLGDGLKGAGPAVAGGGSGRFRHAVVAAEIALSLVWILSAGLLMRSFNAVMAVDPGFEAASVLLIPVALPASSSAADRHRFYRESFERIGSLPGVTAVAASSAVPPFDSGQERR